MPEGQTFDLTTHVNGRRVQQAVAVRQHLADFLRGAMELTGTHLGCEHGVCGACTVLLDGSVVRGCLVLAVQAEGRLVETIEGLAASGRLTPLLDAFARRGAVQCGYCSAGMLLTAHALLERQPRPTRGEVRRAIAGNICRCTGYQSIVDAICEAATTMAAA